MRKLSDVPDGHIFVIGETFYKKYKLICDHPTITQNGQLQYLIKVKDTVHKRAYWLSPDILVYYNGAKKVSDVKIDETFVVNNCPYLKVNNPIPNDNRVFGLNNTRLYVFSPDTLSTQHAGSIHAGF